MHRTGNIICDTGGYLVVAVGDGAQMTCPTGELVRRLAWGDKEDAASVAASAIESYLHLVEECSDEELLRRVKYIRKARAVHLRKKEQ